MKLTEDEILVRPSYQNDDSIPANYVLIIKSNTIEESERKKRQILENQKLRELVEAQIKYNKQSSSFKFLLDEAKK